MTLQINHAPLLPGIAVGHLPAAPQPAQLLQAGTALLAYAEPGRTFSLSDHQVMWGMLPPAGLNELITAADAIRLVGAGGAGFPTARKLRSLAGTKPGPVVVNGAEGETASGKDTVLLTHTPHLVLDGAVAAARAIGSRSVIVRIPSSRSGVIEIVRRAIAERHDAGLRLQVSPGADTFLAGEASAVVSSLGGGPSLPVPMAKPPRQGRATVLLSNVETFARLALAVRGMRVRSSLVTVSGAVATAGVLELDPATTIGEVLDRAGADPLLAAVITGGWHGTWLPGDARTRALALNRDALRAHGAHFGAGALIALPSDPCPVTVLHAVADFLLAEGGGQCGPCVLGMNSARDDLRAGREPVDRVRGRGFCAHPTASIAALRSGQTLFADELRAHAVGQCAVTR